MSEQWREAFEELRLQLVTEAANTPTLRVVMAQTTPGGNSDDDLIRRAVGKIGDPTILSDPIRWRVTYVDGEVRHHADTRELNWTIALCGDADPAAFRGLVDGAGALLEHAWGRIPGNADGCSLFH